MAIAMCRYSIKRIAQWRRSRAFKKATKCRHWASTCSDSTNRTHQRRLILTFHSEKGLELTCFPLILIGVWHIKVIWSTYLILGNTFLGWLN
jgi:hypothetical protein